MNLRQEFLTRFFVSLDANGVAYCVMRNHGDIFKDAETDVDLLVASPSLTQFKESLEWAARQSSFRFVRAARHANYSQVYWQPKAGFIRIDFQTELRWRLFPVLSARTILDARQPHNGFFIPHPRHESVILFVAAIWRGLLSDRYRERLAWLYAACVDKAELRQTLQEAFGPAGDTLAGFQSQLPVGQFDRAFCSRLRRSLIWAAHRSGRRFLALVQNTATDALRLVERLRRPDGVSLLYVSPNQREQNFDDLIRRIDFVFPSQKCIVRSFDLTGRVAARARRGPALWLQRQWVSFKGGLIVHAYRLGRETDVRPVIRTHARYLVQPCTFVCIEDSCGQLYFGHVLTGFMALPKLQKPSAETDFSQLFIEFMVDVLGRHAAKESAGCPARGVFCVLVGLDGAGKTTLARNLCDLVAREIRFHGVRYFHWRPNILRPAEFPLPEFQNLPRKQAVPKNLFNSALSAVRLAKNVAMANVAWQLRLRPLLRRGYLVLVDRYFYNYYLDPVSVKYSGPKSCLDLARRLFPAPDVVVTLHAPTEILLRRKQELPEAEILRQAATLETMKFDQSRVISADASQPASELARHTMAEILKAAT